MRTAFPVRRLLRLLSSGSAGRPSTPSAPVFARPELEQLEDRRMLDAGLSTIPIPGPGPILKGEISVAANPQSGAPIIFMGDSITEFFAQGTGKPVWDQYLAPLGAWNTAVAGQSTSNVLFQLECGLLWGSNPAVVVLMVGTNNLAIYGDSPLQTAEGVLADVQAIHSSAPLAQVLVLGVPPSTMIPAGETAQTNAWTQFGIAQLPYANEVTYADVGAAFLQADGSIAPYVLFDGVHPTTYGYALEYLALQQPLYHAIASWYENLLTIEQYYLTHSARSAPQAPFVTGERGASAP